MTSCRTHAPAYVPETRFGIWFLRTHTWEHHVLRVAINDLIQLIATPLPKAPVILDAGCGQGKSFRLLGEAFSPGKIVGIAARMRGSVKRFPVVGKVSPLTPSVVSAPKEWPDMPM